MKISFESLKHEYGVKFQDYLKNCWRRSILKLIFEKLRLKFECTQCHCMGYRDSKIVITFAKNNTFSFRKIFMAAAIIFYQNKQKFKYRPGTPAPLTLICMITHTFGWVNNEAACQVEMAEPFHPSFD